MGKEGEGQAERVHAEKSDTQERITPEPATAKEKVIQAETKEALAEARTVAIQAARERAAERRQITPEMREKLGIRDDAVVEKTTKIVEPNEKFL